MGRFGESKAWCVPRELGGAAAVARPQCFPMLISLIFFRASLSSLLRRYHMSVSFPGLLYPSNSFNFASLFLH